MDCFPCTGCGECCKHIAHIKELVKFDRGDGVCVHLDLETLTCKIYENRPEICQVDFMYKRHYQASMSKEEFYTLNIQACNLLQENNQVPESYRINIKESKD